LGRRVPSVAPPGCSSGRAASDEEIDFSIVVAFLYFGEVAEIGDETVRRKPFDLLLPAFAELAVFFVVRLRGSSAAFGRLAFHLRQSTAEGNGSTSATNFARHPSGVHARLAASMPLHTLP
jgi:hypothetical protein